MDGSDNANSANKYVSVCIAALVAIIEKCFKFFMNHQENQFRDHW